MSVFHPPINSTENSCFWHQIKCRITINQHTDIAAVSKRLGHSRTSVTLDIDTHAIKEADKDAADKLEGIAQAVGIVVS